VISLEGRRGRETAEELEAPGRRRLLQSCACQSDNQQMGSCRIGVCGRVDRRDDARPGA
jgi:hypothetical protein